MGSPLANGVNTPFGTQESLLKSTDNLELNGTLRKISDGAGNDTGLYLAIDKIGINESVVISVTSTKINYLTDVTSNIQAQINSKLASADAASTYLTIANASSTYLTQANASSTYLTIANAASTYLALADADTDNISEGSNLYFTEARVRASVLTGLSVTGGSISSTDSILAAFGKLQNQVNAVLGGAAYQGTWNASTNTPSLTSSTGTQGYYYVVDVAGSTNLDGITDWKVGDWAIFNGSTWDKVDNTDAVSSVDGMIGAVDLSGTYQAISTNLTTYAGIAPSANVQTLLGAANYAAFKTSLSLNAVENTALSTWAGSSSITTLGTVATGTWNATAIGLTKGGTGFTSYAAGDLIYASATNTLAKLAAGTNNHVLTLSGGLPVWAAPSGGGGATDFNDIGDATNTGSVTNDGYAQTWTWDGLTTGTGLTMSSSSLSSGSLMNLTVTGTARITAAKGLEILMGGTNSSASQTTYGLYVLNNGGGTTPNNVGVYGEATGAQSYGGHFYNGSTSGIALVAQCANTSGQIAARIGGSNNGAMAFGSLGSSESAIWAGAYAPLFGGGGFGNTSSNYGIRFASNVTTLNGGTTVYLAYNNLIKATLNSSGLTLDTILILDASTTAGASMKLTTAVAPPTSPTEGDIWSDGTDVFYRNSAGVTKTFAWV